MNEYIEIKGAHENNLKNISVNIPRNKMTVITGLSGSGKSSLAFDTIYAEGQRRYVESLSAYARQFLGNMTKPAVEYIGGLSPSISIDQKTTNRNPRSTVGTVTEIYDYYRLLYARIGKVHCPKCGKLIEKQSIDQMVDKIMSLDEGEKMMIVAPIIRSKKGEHKNVFKQIQQDGYVRVYVDGELYDIESVPELEKNKNHNIAVVVDRLIRRDNIEKRLVDSLETALELGNGYIVVETSQGNIPFSENFACIDCGISLEEVSTRLFSFNSPFGMCETCNGLGFFQTINPDRLITNGELSIKQGAIASYGNTDMDSFYMKMFAEIAKHWNFSLDAPIKEAPKGMIDEILYGTNYAVKFTYKSGFDRTGRRKTVTRRWEGAVNNLQERYDNSSSDWVQEVIGEFIEEVPCKTCGGKRLNKEALSVRVCGLNIAELTELDVEKEIEFFENLKLSEMENKIAEEILKEIKERLGFLKDVGLGYLNLSRMAGSLSGGESQRIRLATQIGSKLVGVTYVLDEPSIGLHQRDNAKLLKTLRELTDIGNTVLVVEHDEDTMREADYILDIGPGAGVHGGEIVAFGTPKQVMRNKKSITGQYLSGKKKIEVPKERRKPVDFVTVKNAHENNLKNIDVKIPTGVITAVTGVSGSGKSSLVNEILYKNLARDLNKSKIKPGKSDGVENDEVFDKVVVIDQSPIGRTPRSNPATYTGVFDGIRDVFAMTNEAKARGYKKGRFSFNVKGGRCEACKGDGIIKVEMHFLPDVYVPCEVCKGKRYNRETLEVKFKDKTISDVLDMTVEEAMYFFENHPKISRKLETMYNVGLGYIKLGQSSTSLSGGEAQRVKLATELSKRATGRTIYILDEPTTGLHSEDVSKLIQVLDELAEGGNTIVVIEHNLDVIKTSDYVIDLGPEGGDKGGTIVAQGTPEEVAKVKKSYTGQFLKKLLD
ncbi:excinuclease ABC subunit UvrA [uncultured Ezakiella sp.]|uniref:excinuclease ABC subunit UvrA n=1 Tax=uncultured Ezakiella sp. TaxID=1637529 RepID=UPI0025E76731|nr:excinuclease ABC subunit UvrA [uncultured Ezakiella sp.]